MKLSEVCEALGVACNEDKALTGLCIDSRQLKPGQLFVAIRGERFDGHDFIIDAAAQGAAAIMCHQRHPDIAIPQLVVPDTIQALAAIATVYRQKQPCQVIAVTGSNGKTTVKEMIASILPQPAFATPGNLNNHIGVPLSVLQLKEEHRYAVFELGASHLGEIAHTVAIVQPEVTLVNNIAPAHIEGFGSIDGVANAKGEIYQGLLPGGTAVVNDDDAYAHYWDTLLADKQILRFSVTHAADIYARDIHFNASGCGCFTLVVLHQEVSIELQVPGLHNVRNALAAASCTYALGIGMGDIVRGLQQFGGVPGRMTFRQGKNKALVIDDTYNANLRSSLTAIDVLAKRDGRRIFVFGDMGELGEWSEQHHQEVGLAAKKQGIDVLMTCGVKSEFSSRAYGEQAKHYRHQDELVHDLLTQLDENTTVLVKGSRSSRMENIVQKLMG